MVMLDRYGMVVSMTTTQKHQIAVENNGQRYGSIYRARCLTCKWVGERDWTANRAIAQHHSNGGR